MNKRLIYAIIIIVIAIAAAIGIYFLFFRQLIAPPTPPPPAPLPLTGLPAVQPGAPGLPLPPPTVLPVAPEIAQGGLTATKLLTDHQVLNATLGSDGQSVAYYDRTNGLFYKAASDGSISKISNKQFPDVQNVTWAAGAEKAILEFPDSSKIFFDFQKNEQVTLPKHWESFNFSPDGEQIVAKSIGINVDNRWLITSNADGSQAKAIEPLGENANRVISSWSPTNEVIAFSNTGEPIGLDSVQMLLVGQNHENFKGLVVEGRDFRPLWTKDGNQIVYSVYNSQNNFNPTLWISGARGDNIGDNRRTIGLNTWTDKCAFGGQTTLYCAVPTYLPEGYGLQPSLALSIPDQIYKVDINTGAKTLLGAPAENSSMNNLSVSQDGKYLFFTDANSGVLRRMQLK